MGRQEVKQYMMAQTIHQRPLVEGVVARMPEGAYDYIEANPLLSAWREDLPPSCEYDMREAVAQLQADDFVFVIVHGQEENLQAYFAETPQAYAGEGLVAYNLEDFANHLPCD